MDMDMEKEILKLLQKYSKFIETDNWTYEAIVSDDFKKLSKDIVKLLNNKK